MKRIIFIAAFLALLGSFAFGKDYLKTGNRYLPGVFDFSEAENVEFRFEKEIRDIRVFNKSNRFYLQILAYDGCIYEGSIDKNKEINSLKQAKCEDNHKNFISSQKAVYEGNSLFVDYYGYLKFSGDKSFSIDIPVLPDAQIVLYSHIAVVPVFPTEIYRHGALGDSVESKGFIVFDMKKGEIIKTVRLPGNSVIEQRMLILADIDKNSRPEVIATVSDPENGATVIAYNINGEEIYRSKPIGKGFRWRHVFAAASFNGENIEIINVVTPHIGGKLQFLRVHNKSLIQTAEFTPVSSHRIGSKKLGMGLVVDFDGDALPEVIVPDTAHEKLLVIKKSGTKVEKIHEIELNSNLCTNITGYADNSGVKALAFASCNGLVYIYRTQNSD
ncbi:L-dopachrome tautomerase-related protein [Flexistipes sinusarabici]|uniref:L-dopachrome tautomerase-related protein n=1 Tax=Flexistipes sinusarabici TaxID=2352 RepID=UPI0023555425|nr:L-dopachrome tautomerase-related protein [Flexistipes sinusarabici]